jgi:hypothetical protein
LGAAAFFGGGVFLGAAASSIIITGLDLGSFIACGGCRGAYLLDSGILIVVVVGVCEEKVVVVLEDVGAAEDSVTLGVAEN